MRGHWTECDCGKMRLYVFITSATVIFSLKHQPFSTLPTAVPRSTQPSIRCDTTKSAFGPKVEVDNSRQ